MCMVHGRGATAMGILQLAPVFAHPYFYYAAPQADQNTWYPWSFLEPREKNEPGISSGLQVLHDILQSILNQGIPPEKTFFLGFSQCAFLASVFLARLPYTLCVLIVLCGGMICLSVLPYVYDVYIDS